MASSVGTKEWQSAQLKLWGFSHVSPDEVGSSYASFADAAMILGREDLAYELSSRVTPGLCQKYAPLLSVLRRLAKDPLSVPLPNAIKLSQSTSPQGIWEEAMVGLDNSILETEPESSDPPELNDSELSQSEADSVHNESEADESSEISTTQSEILPTESGFGKYAVRDLILSEPSQTMRQEDLVQELKLFLEKFPCWEYQRIHGISVRCSNSVWMSFRQLADDIWSLDSRKAALAEIRELNCVTITDFLLEVERVCFKHQITRTFVNTEPVNAWLHGTMHARLSSLTLEGLNKAMNIPDQLRHQRLVDAVVFAIIARELGAEIPDDSVFYEDAHQYSRAVNRIYSRNADIAMGAGLRDWMLTIWNKLSSIYMAQDPRILMFIHEKSMLASNSEVDADSLLRGMVPGVTLGFNGVPRMKLELPPCLESFYGRNLQRIFAPEALERLWLRITNAFELKNQEVELDMASIASEVRNKVLSIKAPEPLLEVGNLVDEN